MGKIVRLPRDLAEKIAAGEVVERPASIVKELVENSIDAGASSIIVEVEEGGRKKIVVVDDGAGMDREDLTLSVERHATSKLRTEPDLWNIQTMGFRGEALSAIGSVSKLKIESKLNSGAVLEGSIIEVNGGDVSPVRPAGCAGGTKIIVEDLFFNVPARLKFLRKPALELSHIADVVSSLALANPSLRFELISDGRRKLFFPATKAGDEKGLCERVLSVVGEKHRDCIMSVLEDGGEISVNGFFSDMGSASGKDIHVFLNNRPLRDKLLQHAVSSAMADGDGRGVFPSAVLWVKILPSKVDVNVHPAKREVRFLEPSAVHDFIRNSLKKSLSTNKTFAAADVLRISTSENTITNFETQNHQFSAEYSSTKSYGSSSSATSLRFPQKQKFVQEMFTDDFKRTIFPIGQFGMSYILCEGENDELILIDQHAAHERIGFDVLMEQYKSGTVSSQLLFIPERVELGEKPFAYISECLPALEKAGFEIEPFGGRTVIVKAVPEIMSQGSASALLEKLAEELEEFGSKRSIEELVEKIFSVVACHAQVRAGKKLEFAEMERLVHDVERFNAARCPHGRPVMVKFPKMEVEKWFRRRS